MIGQKCALLVDEERLWIGEELAVFPSTFHLRYFLLDGHAREQVRHALFDRQLWIAIGQDVLGERARTPADADREKKRNQACERLSSREQLHGGLQAKCEHLQYQE